MTRTSWTPSFFRPALLPFVILALWFAVLFVGLKQHSQSFYFQDETEHVTNGWMLVEFGSKLYTEVTSNHQPLPILAGAGLMEVIPYNTLFQLIERLRLSMLLFQLVTAVVIVARFRWRGLLAVMLYSSLSFYFFGWYVLAESLAAPAIVWVVLALLETKRSKATATHTSTSLDKTTIVTQVALWWLFFNLLPLWPLVGLSQLWLWFHSTWLQRKLALAINLVLSVLLFLLVNPFDWFREAIMNNVQFFLPYEKTLTADILPRLIFLPFLSFLSPESATARFMAGCTFLLVALAIYWRKKLKQPYVILRIVFLVGLLLSLNTRVSDPEAIFYSGFHLFPYLAALSAVVAFGATEFFKLSKKLPTVLRLLPAAFVILIVATSNPWLFSPSNKMSEYFIQYSTYEAYGKAIATVAPESATLLSGPDGAGYMNIMGNIPIAGRQLFHLQWAYRSPMLHDAFMNMLENNPPTFVYFPAIDENGFYDALQPKLATDYLPLQRTDGSNTQLMMRKDVLPSVSEEQWQQLEAESFRRLQ